MFLGGSLEGFCRTFDSIDKLIVSLDRNEPGDLVLPPGSMTGPRIKIDHLADRIFVCHRRHYSTE